MIFLTFLSLLVVSFVVTVVVIVAKHLRSSPKQKMSVSVAKKVISSPKQTMSSVAKDLRSIAQQKTTVSNFTKAQFPEVEDPLKDMFFYFNETIVEEIQDAIRQYIVEQRAISVDASDVINLNLKKLKVGLMNNLYAFKDHGILIHDYLRKKTKEVQHQFSDKSVIKQYLDNRQPPEVQQSFDPDPSEYVEVLDINIDNLIESHLHKMLHNLIGNQQYDEQYESVQKQLIEESLSNEQLFVSTEVPEVLQAIEHSYNEINRMNQLIQKSMNAAEIASLVIAVHCEMCNVLLLENRTKELKKVLNICRQIQWTQILPASDLNIRVLQLIDQKCRVYPFEKQFNLAAKSLNLRQQLEYTRKLLAKYVFLYIKRQTIHNHEPFNKIILHLREAFSYMPIFNHEKSKKVKW